MIRIAIIAVMLLVGISQPAYAQDTCPAVVETALEQLDTACIDLGRNQVCYGNVAIDAAGADTLTFSEVGDIAAINEVEILELSPYDDKDFTWGIALMQVQANIPDTIPGQNVTFLMFGDVVLENAGAEAILVTTSQETAISPEPQGEQIDILPPETELRATGRTDDAAWLRIIMPDGWEAWLSAADVQTEADLSDLPVVGPDNVPFYGPMQAVYFRTGIGNAGCEAMPDDGVLIQTPGDVGRISLLMNEVMIDVGSTIYVQAVPSGDMTVSTIEGGASVAAFEGRVSVPAGMQVTIPLDANGVAAGPPSAPKPYNAADLAALPTFSLKTPVPVAPPQAFEDYFNDLKATAQSHFEQGLYFAAIDNYSELIYVSSDDVQIAGLLSDRGYAYFFLGENQNAISDFTESINLAPDVGETYFGRGLAYQVLAEFELALADYDRAVESEPENPDYTYQRALAHYFNGDYESAIADQTATLDIDADFVDAYRERGNLYYDLGDGEAALADYRAYVQRVEVPVQEVLDRIEELGG